MSESKHLGSQDLGTKLGTSTSSGSITRSIATALREIGEFLGIAFNALFSILLDPKFLFICWALFLYFGIDTVFRNYENTRPAHENYWAWAFWLSSVIVAIVFIYRYPSECFPDPDPPNSPPPKSNTFKKLFKKLRKIFRYILLIGSIIILIIPVLYGLYHYYKDESFQRYRFEVEQLDCDYHKLDFLKKMSRTDEYPKGRYYSELLGTFVGDKDALCETTQKLKEAYGFIKWLGLVGEYYAASGMVTVVLDNKALEARATWVPIYSTWYKHDGTWTARIRASKEGGVICHYLKSAETLVATLNVTPYYEGLNDNFFSSSADLKGIPNGELIEVQARAHLSTNEFELSSLTLGEEWVKVEFKSPSRSSQTDQAPFTRTFICKEEQLPSKKPQSSQKNVKP